jgi:hypothetical protein
MAGAIRDEEDEQAKPGLGHAEDFRHLVAEEVDAAFDPAQDLDGERDGDGADHRTGDRGHAADDQHGEQGQRVVK